MKSEFIEKTVCVLGASIVANGGFVYDLRSYFHSTKEKCCFYNRGIGGNRAIMASALAEDEVLSLNPDYAMICYGVNDVGIWLYDVNKKVTDEVLKERAERDVLFYQGYKQIAEKLLKRGVQPIVCSPFPPNKYFKNEAKVDTLGDNREKSDNVRSGFYCPQNLTALFEKLAEYSENLKKYANDAGLLFWDIFGAVAKKADGVSGEGVYEKDGIHISERGHALIAQAILEFMECENIPRSFEKSCENDAIKSAEERERAIQYFDWGMFHPLCNAKGTREEIVRISESEKTEEWLKKFAAIYLAHGQEKDKIRKEIIRLTREFCLRSSAERFKADSNG